MTVTQHFDSHVKIIRTFLDRKIVVEHRKSPEFVGRDRPAPCNTKDAVFSGIRSKVWKST